MNVKVCGITTVEQLQQLQQLGADYAGLIFYEKSKRYAWKKLQEQKSKIQNLTIRKVGVFVNADMEFLKSCIRDFGLAAVQLHGDETPAYCEALQNEAAVIKVFRIGEETKTVNDLIEPFQDVCEYYLFDTDTAGYGGSGKRFDWTILENTTVNKPFFLSGGIGLEAINNLKGFQHPHFYAVDINSRFETAPGIKDMQKVELFINAFKQPTWIK